MKKLKLPQTIYFVDGENIHNSIFDGTTISALSRGDKIRYYYGKNNQSINIEYKDFEILMNAMYEFGREFITFEAVPVTGSNAMDFWIISEASVYLKKYPSRNIVFITKDKGFEAAVEYWKYHGVTRIHRRDDIIMWKNYLKAVKKILEDIMLVNDERFCQNIFKTLADYLSKKYLYMDIDIDLINTDIFVWAENNLEDEELKSHFIKIINDIVYKAGREFNIYELTKVTYSNSNSQSDTIKDSSDTTSSDNLINLSDYVADAKKLLNGVSCKKYIYYKTLNSYLGNIKDISNIQSHLNAITVYMIICDSYEKFYSQISINISGIMWDKQLIKDDFQNNIGKNYNIIRTGLLQELKTNGKNISNFITNSNK